MIINFIVYSFKNIYIIKLNIYYKKVFKKKNISFITFLRRNNNTIHNLTQN
jgi:hypothetical protein